ncbi:MAG: lipocalin family protein [Bacteroidota bacterium]
MKFIAWAFTILFLPQTLQSQDGPMDDLTVVPTVDPRKYSGVWYEIARLPNRFQNDCIGDVTATYTLDGEEFIVVNRCRKENGEMTEAEGRARRSDDDEPNSKLKVRFAPAFLSFLPFVWGNYWIIDLGPDYSYAVIGEPNRKYLWILARTTTLDDLTMAGILDRIQQKGYDTKDLIFTKHVSEGSSK